MRTKTHLLKMLCAFTTSILVAGSLSTPALAAKKGSEADRATKPVVSKVNANGYRLDKAVVLSRHDVRAPLATPGSDLYKMTPHKWINWSSNASELSSKGGILETEMGQYFRKYLIQRGLFVENEIPSENSVLFYANSMQRTIATAQYFSSGFLPIGNSKIVYKYKPSTMDPVFNPQLTYVTPEFEKQALSEIAQMGGKKGLAGIEKKLDPNFKLLAKILDLKHSEKAKKDGYKAFPTNDLKVNFVKGKEPNVAGSALQVATVAADALTLQYYETLDAKRAAFGNNLTLKQWEKIAHIKDVYGDVLFAAPTVARNVANPMLKEIQKDLSSREKFVFLVGHDSNIASVLSALDFKKYSLPQSIEKTTPIGSKVLMEVWENSQNQKFVTFKMVYFSLNQLRHLKTIDLQDPPMVYDLSLNGIAKNRDGMYSITDVQNRFDQSIKAYDLYNK